MQGMLADVNVQGHLKHLIRCLESMDLWDLPVEEAIDFKTFTELGLPPDWNDRLLWNFCQSNGLVLFTNDKNNDDPDSLQATMDDSWKIGLLPVLTLANQGLFVRDGSYTRRVANDIAGLLLDIKSGENLDRPRIFVPVR